MSYILDFEGDTSGSDKLQEPVPPPEVPANLLGLTSLVQLQLVEDTVVAFRGWEVTVGQIYSPSKFDTEHLRSLHEYLMRDVYPIVGETRTDYLNYELSQQRETPGSRLPEMPTSRLGTTGQRIALLPAADVNARLDKLASLLEQENYLMGHDKLGFVSRLAAYYVQYRYAFPFSTGTAYVLTAAFWRLGKEAGYEVAAEQAASLDEVSDAVVQAGLGSDQRRLIQVLLAVVTEGPGEEAALRRKITMQVLPATLPT